MNAVRAWAERLRGEVARVADRTAIRMGATVQWLSLCLAGLTVFGVLISGSAPVDLSTRLRVVMFGLVDGLLVWSAISLITNRLVAPERANSRSFTELRCRLATARRRLGSSGTSAVAASLREQIRSLDRRSMPGDPDPEWSNGMAYVNRWLELHSIEEELILLAGPERQEAILLHDELRIEGSKLDNRNGRLRKQIDAAKAVLKATPQSNLRDELNVIHRAVNGYRDRRFDALVRGTAAMNNRTALLGLTAWAALAFSILAGAALSVVLSVAAFYLVGTGTGLLTQLRGNRVSKSIENVYGYGEAQTRQTVLLSGLAAVVGVAFTWVAANGAASGVTVNPLGEAFALTPISLATAALFGFAPGPLLDRMSGWARSNVEDLEETLSPNAED